MTRPMQSETLKEWTAALVKAQAVFPNVKKGDEAEIRSAKGAYKYRYADLGAVVEAIRGPLTANGFAWTAPIEEDDKGPYLRTELIHVSGEWKASEVRLYCDFSRPQDAGSFLTYFRRYALLGLAGVATEDDDGAAAQTAPARQEYRRPTPSAPYRNGYEGRRPLARDEADLAAQDEVADSIAPPNKPRRPAPRTGRELYSYATTCRTDPDLTHWILGQFPRYPHRFKDWTDNQVVSAWPAIREHLLECKAARNSASTAVHGNGATS